MLGKSWLVDASSTKLDVKMSRLRLVMMFLAFDIIFSGNQDLTFFARQLKKKEKDARKKIIKENRNKSSK